MLGMFMEETERRLVLVTGCTGFVASHVVKALAAEGGRYAVRGTVRRAGDARALCEAVPGLEPLFEEAVCDLMDARGWEEAMRGVHTVFHVASPVSLKNTDDEVEGVLKPALNGTVHVLEAAARSGTVRRVVVTSSVASVYGSWTDASPLVLDESQWTDPWSPSCGVYARSKVASELTAWLFGSRAPIPREEILRRLTPPPPTGAGGAKGAAWLRSKLSEIRARTARTRLEVVTVLPPIVLGTPPW